VLGARGKAAGASPSNTCRSDGVNQSRVAFADQLNREHLGSAWALSHFLPRLSKTERGRSFGYARKILKGENQMITEQDVELAVEKEAQGKLLHVVTDPETLKRLPCRPLAEGEHFISHQQLSQGLPDNK
jgi:hypothetical protein